MNSLKNADFPHGNHPFAGRNSDFASEPKKVRLLKFVCDFGSGGTEGQVFNLVRGLRSAHCTPECACLNKTGPFVEKYTKQGIASIRDRGVYLSRTQRLLQKLVCRMADRILVNAESIRDWLLDEGYQEHKITVIKNGIDLTLYETTEVNAIPRNTIRSDQGVQENSSLVVMLARLNRQKGIVDFIRAAALIKREHPATRFLIIGKPSLDSMKADKGSISDLQHWLNLRSELLLEDTLFFCGHRSDVPQILAQAAVSVLPSHNEGLSNTLLESMAAGVPIVATRILVELFLHRGLDVNFGQHPETVVAEHQAHFFVHVLETFILDNSVNCVRHNYLHWVSPRPLTYRLMRSC